MDSDMDSDLANFCSVTGANSQVARDYLQIADNNLEMAITLYLENGGNTLTSTQREASSSPSTETTTDTNFTDDAAVSDEALARQLQDQEESRRSQQSNGVRAPIAPRTDILTGDGGGDGSLFDMSMTYSGIERRWNGRRQQQQDDPLSIFNQGDSSYVRNTPIHLVRSAAIAAASTSSSSPTGTTDDSIASPAGEFSERTRRLADLFRPPFDIMHRGDFEEARAAAREQSKWLLINVQDPTEFACQVLNRDLWNDTFVKDIVRESFVFLQYTNGTSNGKRYLTLYPINQYPHVAIIDARTGERIKTWENQLVPTEFMMEVTEFLERHSTDPMESTLANKSTKPKNKPSDMSEEEQLNAAIAASLESSQVTDVSTDSNSIGSPSTDDQEEMKHKLDVAAAENSNEENNESATSSVLDSILPIKRQETNDMTNSTRIQFRMADGSRIIRRFLKSDPVRYLFEFIKSHVPETQDQAFELVFNRQQLIDILDQGIQVAGLQNAAVNVQFA